jgi:chromosome segregation ATPase
MKLSPELKSTFDELDNNYGNFYNIKEMLMSFSPQVKEDYQELYTSLICMFETYTDKQIDLCTKLLNLLLETEKSKSKQYSDEELDLMCSHAELAEKTKKLEKLQQDYNHLQIEHEELQQLYSEISDELDEVYNKSILCSLDYDKLKDDYDELLSKLES